MQPGQVYTPPQINNPNYYQTNPQINSDTPLTNMELNNQKLSCRRKVTSNYF